MVSLIIFAMSFAFIVMVTFVRVFIIVLLFFHLNLLFFSLALLIVWGNVEIKGIAETQSFDIIVHLIHDYSNLNSRFFNNPGDILSDYISLPSNSFHIIEILFSIQKIEYFHAFINFFIWRFTINQEIVCFINFVFAESFLNCSHLHYYAVFQLLHAILNNIV